MKSVLGKFQISSALDGHEPFSPALRRRLQNTDELRSFEAAITRVERDLRASVPPCEAPPGLHGSIMCAVRDAAGSRCFVWPAWIFKLAAPGLALVLGFALWAHREPPGLRPEPALAAGRPFAAGPAALAMGEQVAASGPAIILAPLCLELERVNQDLEAAKETLLAALP